MGSDAEIQMWSFWETAYGPMKALEDYYPALLEARPDLQASVTMIKNGERIINSIMEELDLRSRK